jgi:hypothetical protein
MIVAKMRGTRFAQGKEMAVLGTLPSPCLHFMTRDALTKLPSPLLLALVFTKSEGSANWGELEPPLRGAVVRG